MDINNSIEGRPPVPPRNDLVKTAAEFLATPKVQKSPMEVKVAFLKKKGLSDAEIDLAVEQCEDIVRTKVKASQLIQHAPPTGMELVYPSYQAWPQQSRWERCRDIINTVNFLVGTLYIGYWFYKKYIIPYLFGRGKKSLDNRISDLEKSVTSCLDEIKGNISRVKEDVERIAERRGDSVNRQIDDLKVEITSLKKLLLHRKQFPPGPVGIPSWQIAASPLPVEKETEEEGAGSGTNGSDSSLEMIKE